MAFRPLPDMGKPNSYQLTETPRANINISGGTFYSVAGDAHHYHNNYVSTAVPDDRGLQILLQSIASEALYDSAAVSRASMCHPNTRNRILKRMLDWVGDDSASSVFWLHGRVGEGKTAVMRSVADSLSDYPSNLPTFFFGRGKGKREHAQYLFPTLAHQLALSVPGLRPHVNEIVIEKPTVLTSSMDVQVRSLFIDAFRRLQGQNPDHDPSPQTILIDGLDECDNEGDQQTILKLVGDMVTVHALPLLFIIASRPESQIREMFDGVVLRKVTLQASISDDPSSLEDIEVFFREKFAEIYGRKSHLLSDIDAPNWPSDEVIKALVHRSSGQFIYASTVIKFVDDKFSHPEEQLGVILSASSGSAAFSELDSLYRQILSAYPPDKIEGVKRVLSFVIAMSRSSGRLLEDLLQLHRGEAEIILGGLHSVLSGIVPSKRASTSASDWKLESLRAWPEFARTLRYSNVGLMLFTPMDPDLDVTHASFVDFILDPRRSVPYNLDLASCDVRIVEATFLMMSGFIFRCLQGNFQRPFSVDTVVSMNVVLSPHLAKIKTLPRSVFDSIAQIEEALGIADLMPGSSMPVESFVGIYLFITGAMKKLKDISTEFYCQLLGVNNRYLELLFLWCDRNFPLEGGQLGEISGVLVIQDDLSPDALADIFMVQSQFLDNVWKDQGLDIKMCASQSVLLRSLECLSTLDPFLERNRVLHQKVQRRHMAICCKIVSRIFDGSSAPRLEVIRYITNHFSDHLHGLTLVPSERATAVLFLDILKKKIEDVQLAGKLPNSLISIWMLLKKTLTWLSTLEKEHSGASSLSERIHSTFDLICRSVFHVKNSEHAQNVISIRQPFLRIEEYLTESMSDSFGPLRLYHSGVEGRDLVPYSAIQFDAVDEKLLPSMLSPNVFLLDFASLRLGDYFCNIARAGSLYLSPEKLYSSLFRNLEALAFTAEESLYMVQATKCKMIVRTCIDYLQNAPACSSWLKQCRPVSQSFIEKHSICGLLDWCQFILESWPSSYLNDLERQKVNNIVKSHVHIFQED